jgi:hypothetical protein
MELDEQLELAHLLLDERECRVCGEKKNLLDGYYRTRKNVSLKSSYSYECKECTVKRVCENHRKDPTLEKNRHLKRQYGITFAEFDKMLTEQKNSCAICKTTRAGGKHNSFVVDHDHKTGKVRGLLCKSCNIALGEVKDNIHTLNDMIEYLESHG